LSGTLSVDNGGTGTNSLTGIIVGDGSNPLLAKKSEFNATSPPTVNDDSSNGYDIGSRWIDTVNNKEYVNVDSTNGAAVWVETTGSSQTNNFTIRNWVYIQSSGASSLQPMIFKPVKDVPSVIARFTKDDLVTITKLGIVLSTDKDCDFTILIFNCINDVFQNVYDSLTVNNIKNINAVEEDNNHTTIRACPHYVEFTFDPVPMADVNEICFRFNWTSGGKQITVKLHNIYIK
jgi:hypothetical protein